MLFISAVIVAMGTLALGLLTRHQPGPHRWAVRLCLFSVFAASIYLAWGQYQKDFSRAHSDARAGRLTPPGPMGPLPIILFGGMASLDSRVLFGYSGFPDGLPIQLRLDPAKKTLLITAEIRNASGALIAVIRDNEWQNPIAGYDRNYNDRLFEVVAIDGNHPVLQVMHRGEVVLITGIFHGQDGSTIVALPGKLLPTPADRAYLKQFCQWFRYPSYLHPAEVNQECVDRTDVWFERFGKFYQERVIPAMKQASQTQ